jgi:hypothetical protein
MRPGVKTLDHRPPTEASALVSSNLVACQKNCLCGTGEHSACLQGVDLTYDSRILAGQK